MDKTEIKQRLQALCRDIFDDENLVLKESMSAADIEEWDSLNHISLLNAIEEDFGIKIALNEHKEFKNIGDIIALIERKTQ